MNVFKKGGSIVDLKLGTYLIYLAVSIALTWWVARTLFRNGQVFIDDALSNERLATSVNHLLVVGFYLINLGYIAIMLKISTPIVSGSGAVEALAWKLGLVLLALGIMHFFNVYVLSRFRRRRLLESAPPPVLPVERTVPAAAVPPGTVPPPDFPDGLPPRRRPRS